jgi:hypothetical protein
MQALEKEAALARNAQEEESSGTGQSIKPGTGTGTRASSSGLKDYLEKKLDMGQDSHLGSHLAESDEEHAEEHFEGLEL